MHCDIYIYIYIALPAEFQGLQEQKFNNEILLFINKQMLHRKWSYPHKDFTVLFLF